MNFVDLPEILKKEVQEEEVELSLKSKRLLPIRYTLSIFLFGLVFALFSAVFALIMFWPLFMGEEVHFTVNGVPKVASMDNLSPLFVPSVFISIFLLIGLSIMAWAVYLFSKDGAFFVITPSRLVYFSNGELRSLAWNMFLPDVRANGLTGDIALKIKNSALNTYPGFVNKRSINEIIFISGVDNVFELASLIRKHIEDSGVNNTK